MVIISFHINVGWHFCWNLFLLAVGAPFCLQRVVCKVLKIIPEPRSHRLGARHMLVACSFPWRNLITIWNERKLIVLLLQGSDVLVQHGWLVCCYCSRSVYSVWSVQSVKERQSRAIFSRWEYHVRNFLTFRVEPGTSLGDICLP